MKTELLYFITKGKLGRLIIEPLTSFQDYQFFCNPNLQNPEDLLYCYNIYLPVLINNLTLSDFRLQNDFHLL